MALHVRWDRGHQVYYDTHLKRVIKVVGPNCWNYKLRPAELNPSGTDPTGWTTTVVEVGAGTSEFNPADEIDRVGNLITAGNEDDGINVQLLGEVIKLDSNHSCYFGVQFEINDVIQSDLFAGFAIVDTTLLGGVSDALYFESLDGSASVNFVAEKDNTETTESAVGTLVADTLHFLEFYWDGTKVQAFFDGASIYYATPDELPDNEELRLSLHFLTGEVAAQTLKIKTLRASQWGSGD
jgi:hypothetical protein